MNIQLHPVSSNFSWDMFIVRSACDIS